jgi:stage IV sporulation protein FB
MKKITLPLITGTPRKPRTALFFWARQVPGLVWCSLQARVYTTVPLCKPPQRTNGRHWLIVIRFRILGFPVTIEPFFWIIIALLGGAFRADSPQAVLLLIVWMVVVLVSILVHELGHALAGRHYGAIPEIRLHGFGGMAVMHGSRFNRLQSIIVSAAGPAFGFALGTLVLVLYLGAFRGRELPLELSYGLIMLLYVNFFWTAINLLPIVPLDGGQIFRELAGPRRAGLVRGVAVLCAAAVALWAFQAGMIFLGLMVAYLGFVNFQSGRAQPGVPGGVTRN